MANHIKRVKTTTGNEQIDYTALANLPLSDPSLSFEGGFADAFTTGNELDYLNGKKADTIIKHVEGRFIDLYDSANAQVKELRVMGRTVRTTDGLSNEKTVVESSGGNLLPYPYASSTFTKNDITFTDNGDGSITVSGTASADTVFNLYTGDAIRFATYLSGCDSMDCDLIASDDTDEGQVINNSGYTSVKDIAVYNVYIKVASGKTVNTVIKPMISYTEIEYEPYKQASRINVSVKELRAVPVTENGNYIENDTMWICDEILCNKSTTCHIKRIGVIDSYAGETINTPYLSSSNDGLVEGATVYYVLPKPVITELDMNILRTYYPTTIIKGDAYLIVDYFVDLPKYIENNYVRKDLFNALVERVAKLEA